MDSGLGEQDTRAVLDAASSIVADPPPDIDRVLALLRGLITCDSASFNDMTLSAGDFRYRIVPPDQEAVAIRLKPVYDRLAPTQHPLIVATQTERVNGAIRFCDVPGGATFPDTELFREFFVPFGLRYQMAIELPAPPDVVVGYALNRRSDMGEFSDRDVAVLNALGPHLAMHHRQMIDRERSRAIAEETERGGGWSVMTVRSDGTVEASTSSAALERFAVGGRVPGQVLTLLAIADDPARGATSCDVTVAGTSWRCVLHPVPVGPTVLLVRPLGDETDQAASLVDLGLTPRQTDVAMALARSGGTNAQLARSLDITEGTLKKHLEVVFRSLDVDSRTSAVIALRQLTATTDPHHQPTS